MKFGSGAEHADSLTMLPGCLFCGIGLGLNNTPVTNTATGSVSPDRARMASGIDMSARLITLAINIAIMGFILVEGVLSYLTRVLPASADRGQLRLLAEKVAAGDMALLTHGNTAGHTAGNPTGSAALAAMDPQGSIAHAALVHGFGLVMLYGGVGAGVLALLSVLMFGPGARQSAAANYVG